MAASGKNPTGPPANPINPRFESFSLEETFAFGQLPGVISAQLIPLGIPYPPRARHFHAIFFGFAFSVCLLAGLTGVASPLARPNREP